MFAQLNNLAAGLASLPSLPALATDPLDNLTTLINGWKVKGVVLVLGITALACLIGLAMWATAGGNARQTDNGKTWVMRGGLAAVGIAAVPFLVNAFASLLGLPDINFGFK
jgi:hypothetical protein